MPSRLQLATADLLQDRLPFKFVSRIGVDFWSIELQGLFERLFRASVKHSHLQEKSFSHWFLSWKICDQLTFT